MTLRIKSKRPASFLTVTVVHLPLPSFSGTFWYCCLRAAEHHCSEDHRWCPVKLISWLAPDCTAYLDALVWTRLCSSEARWLSVPALSSKWGAVVAFFHVEGLSGLHGFDDCPFNTTRLAKLFTIKIHFQGTFLPYCSLLFYSRGS